MIEYVVTENELCGEQSIFILESKENEPLVIEKISPELLRELIDQEQTMEVRR